MILVALCIGMHRAAARPGANWKLGEEPPPKVITLEEQSQSLHIPYWNRLGAMRGRLTRQVFKTFPTDPHSKRYHAMLARFRNERDRRLHARLLLSGVGLPEVSFRAASLDDVLLSFNATIDGAPHGTGEPHPDE